MAKQIVRGWSAENVTAKDVLHQINTTTAVWKTSRLLKRALADRAGKPKRTKITILVEFE